MGLASAPATSTSARATAPRRTATASSGACCWAAARASAQVIARAGAADPGGGRRRRDREHPAGAHTDTLSVPARSTHLRDAMLLSSPSAPMSDASALSDSRRRRPRGRDPWTRAARVSRAGSGPQVAPFGNGLINKTYLLARPDGARAVLQRVNPIFSPAIHQNIARGHAAAGRRGADHAVAGRDRDRPALRLDRGRGLARADLSSTASRSTSWAGRPRRARPARSSRGFTARSTGSTTPSSGGAPACTIRRCTCRASTRRWPRIPQHRLAAEVGALAQAIRAGAAALPPLPALPAARLPRRSQVQQHPVRGRRRRPPASSRCA